ncbi:DUF2937 family protein [Lacimicrobium sp. SS2-24]|uniref:DUF2937 family protein n=1 Tax=Lacimicrobium sp. SS2-24 TaxID=2005569 RepID=UPI000B4B525C|nr:DUF2937 family protein [Lacimicrobium sp. SS2-24]
MIKGLLHTCHGYIRLLAFMAALLAGVQLPAFINQYENTLLSHLSEAQQSLGPFIEDARLHTDGSIEQLIARYRQNADAAIRAGGTSLQTLVDRRDYLHGLQAKLQQSQWHRIWYALFAADPRLFAEARAQYDYQVVLNAQAIGWGLVVAISVMVLVDILIGVCALPFRSRQHR